MANRERGIEEILCRWRDEIKRRQRRIISFEETVETKINSLRRWIFPDQEPLDGWECREFIYTRKRERQWLGDWRPIRVGGTWGGPDRSALFRISARLPARFKGKKAALKVYFGGDGLLSVNGRPYHGLDPFRDTVILTNRARGGEDYRFEAESYIFWHFGEPEIKTLECSHFAVVDEAINDAYWDFRAAFNVMMVPGQDPDLVEFLKAGFDRAIWAINQNETDSAVVKRNAGKARAILRKTIYETDRFKKQGLLHLCGNSHLDVVFLWTHAEFVRKLGRTHASTLRLMEQYPDYVFSQSQALLYQEMKSNYPDMYREVKARVKQGRWEVIGASWVEPDCNLISGESFVRQILTGVRFIEKEFGITPRTYWCPDVFGNVWTMPQILRKSGLEYFVTHKMVVWNDTNPWKKHLFWWQGPDGSRVLSVVPPTHFIGTVEPDHMAEHWSHYSFRGSVGETLYNYGWGDGGGGPDPEMLEYLKRYRDFPGVTPAKPNTIEGALDSIRAKAASVAAQIPVVNDELYLEEHRGVFTTKARLKKRNRQCEFLLREAELWSCFAPRPYPKAELDRGWKEVLTNQFHDSLPGSHITPVYHDLLEAYDRAIRAGETVLSDSLAELAAQIDTRGPGKAVAVFNGFPFRRDSLVSLEVPDSDLHVLDPAGLEIPHQFTTDPETGRQMLVFEAEGLPSVGFAVYRIAAGRGMKKFDPVRAVIGGIENRFIRCRLNRNGEMTSLVDKASGVERIRKGSRGNEFHLYEDVPGKYEAWDIAPSYTRVEFPLGPAKLSVAETGPVFSSIEIERRFGKSCIRQRIVLSRSGKRLECRTWVDWREQQKLLKVRFHTPVVARTATYDIAYGNIVRSAYRGNPYDEAKFEVPAHWWADLSWPDGGLSLLTDSKYGYEAFDGTLSLSLLRGPLGPDPVSDQEEHRFTYALYPHTGDWRDSGVYREALDLNRPCACVLPGEHAGILPPVHSLLGIDATNVILEAFKAAECGKGRILRLVERHGRSGPVSVRFAVPIRSVSEVNLLERDESPLACERSGFRFEIKPYEIRTFWIR